MAANAPYYQLRGHGQFTTGTNAQFPTAEDDYDLSVSLAPHHASLYGDSQTSDTHPNTLEENHNFVELLEAATTVAGQAHEAMNTEGMATAKPNQNRGKRKRVSSPSPEDISSSLPGQAQRTAPSSHKRARLNIPTDPQLHRTDVSNASPSSVQSNDVILSDAGAAGLHSAAALFRRSSAKDTARKYTRPPMSKLFVSLQLTPENFLHLQAQAKAYMLDATHPERQQCVGNRGKGDTDMVKLRLFNCVRDFLDDGVGIQFFGEHVEKPAEKDAIEAARALGEEQPSAEARLVWPRDANKIISLVTPLLRRMVTNERQRMYAIETRKGGSKRKEGNVEVSFAHNEGLGSIGMSDHREAMEPAFHRNNMLAIQPQDQHHQSPALVTSLPAHFSPTSNQNITLETSPHPPSIPDMANEQSIEMSKIKERALPTAADRAFDFHKISMFITKDGLKLKLKDRIVGPGPLNDYSWIDFQDRIVWLIRLALATYPQLRPESLRKASQDDVQQTLKSMAPEALRGLAVAATEIQSHVNSANVPDSELRIDSVTEPIPTIPSIDIIGSTTSVGRVPYPDLPSPNPDVREYEASRQSSVDASSPSATVHVIAPKSAPTSPERAASKAPLQPATPGEGDRTASHSLSAWAAIFPQSEIPRYIVKTMLTAGLSEIKDEQDWQNAKLDVGYAVWANGRMSVVIELI